MSADQFITALELPLQQLIDFANSSEENRQLLIRYARLNGCATRHMIECVIR